MIVAASLVWGFFASRAWKSLSGPTFLLVQWLLRAFGQDVVSEPANLVLGTKQFSVGIYPACAGYEGIGLMVLFAGAYLWLFRRSLRFPQAYLLLPCAVFAIWLVNAVRMAGLVLFGTYVSPEIAMGGFHSQAGWLGFIGVALGMVAVTQRMPFFDATETEPADQGPRNQPDNRLPGAPGGLAGGHHDNGGSVESGSTGSTPRGAGNRRRLSGFSGGGR